MITTTIEDLWRSAHDGASLDSETAGALPVEDAEGLLRAWQLERGVAIESEFLLGQSRECILRLIAEADVSAARRRKARRLVRSIDRALGAAGAHDR